MLDVLRRNVTDVLGVFWGGIWRFTEGTILTKSGKILTENGKIYAKNGKVHAKNGKVLTRKKAEKSEVIEEITLMYNSFLFD